MPGEMGLFGVVLCGAATLDVQEMGWSGKLGPGKNLGLPQHDFNH